MNRILIILFLLIVNFGFSQSVFLMQNKSTYYLDLVFQAKKMQTPSVEDSYTIEESTSPTNEYVGVGIKYYDTYTTTISPSSSTSDKTFGSYPALEPIFEHFMDSVDYYSIWTTTAPSAGDELTINFELTFNESKTIHVGLIGDNQFEFYLNGALKVKTDGTSQTEYFTYLHIFPVSVSVGTYYFSFTGIADGSVNDALGAIVWDNSKDELFTNPIAKANWDVLATTETWVDSTINIVTCASGYSYSPTENLCIQIDDLTNISSGDDVLISFIIPTDIQPLVTAWAIDFGDSSDDSGSGLIESIAHTYTLSASYTIEYEITLSTGIKKRVKETITI